MTWYKYTLPLLAATLTNHPRDRMVRGVDFEWSSRCWTHNLFRVWELVFWRRSGIRFESSTQCLYDGKIGETIVVHTLGSWESVFAYTETYLRNLFALPKWRLVKVPIPVHSFAGGYGGIDARRAFVFAIAFDAVTGNKDNSGTVNNITWSHTTTGSDTLMAMNGGMQATNAGSGGLSFTAFTYNSVAGSTVQTAESSTNVSVQLRYLIAPTTGANTVSLTISDVLIGGGEQLTGVTCTYTGCAQSGQPDSSGQNVLNGSTTTNFAVSTTVVASNCWLTGSASEDAGDIAGGAAGAGTTYRGAAQFNQRAADSNGTVSTGAQSLNYGRAGNSGEIAGCTMSIKEPSEAVVTRVPPLFTLLGVGN